MPRRLDRPLWFVTAAPAVAAVLPVSRADVRIVHVIQVISNGLHPGVDVIVGVVVVMAFTKDQGRKSPDKVVRVVIAPTDAGLADTA